MYTNNLYPIQIEQESICGKKACVDRAQLCAIGEGQPQLPGLIKRASMTQSHPAQLLTSSTGSVCRGYTVGEKS